MMQTVFVVAAVFSNEHGNAPEHVILACAS
jgi:hypothetical protein